MNRSPRPALTLVLSLLLMVFSICQAQARVQTPTVPPEAIAQGSHGAHASHGQPPSDCHNDCQHLSGHPDAAPPLALSSLVPGLLAWLPPEPSLDPVTLRALTYHPPSQSAADPPPLLRFQHFLN